MQIGSQCPENVVPTWKSRFALLEQRAKNLIEKYERVGQRSGGSDQVRSTAIANTVKDFPPHTSNSGLFKCTLGFTDGQQSIAFNCQRVMRLQTSRAAALALKYAESFTRPAFARDLGKSVLQPLLTVPFRALRVIGREPQGGGPSASEDASGCNMLSLHDTAGQHSESACDS